MFIFPSFTKLSIFFPFSSSTGRFDFFSTLWSFRQLCCPRNLPRSTLLAKSRVEHCGGRNSCMTPKRSSRIPPCSSQKQHLHKFAFSSWIGQSPQHPCFTGEMLSNPQAQFALRLGLSPSSPKTLTDFGRHRLPPPLSRPTWPQTEFTCSNSNYCDDSRSEHRRSRRVGFHTGAPGAKRIGDFNSWAIPLTAPMPLSGTGCPVHRGMFFGPLFKGRGWLLFIIATETKKT